MNKKILVDLAKEIAALESRTPSDPRGADEYSFAVYALKDIISRVAARHNPHFDVAVFCAACCSVNQPK